MCGENNAKRSDIFVKFAQADAVIAYLSLIVVLFKRKCFFGKILFWIDLAPASGKRIDYFKGIAGDKFTAEVDDDYNPPPSEIEPAFQESWSGIVATVDTVPGVP